MDCHHVDTTGIDKNDFNILLIGNPNVGKSVVFSKLTGLNVLSANYVGTTISYTKGSITHKGKKATLIDAPGTYSLEATSAAEEVAVKMLEEKPNVVICVLDATNLERNLNLALQVQQHNIPLIFALNLIDVAERQGIAIDIDALASELGSPVIPTIAIRNIGLAELLDKAWEAADKQTVVRPQLSQNERWQEVGRIVEKVQQVEHRHPTFWEKMGDWTMQPLPGIPIAFLVLLAALALVVGGGKGLRAAILLPLVNDVYTPFITRIVSGFIPEGVWLNILVGDYGMLIKGIEWPFALILPYVFLFYIVLSILEDSGYMPRLGVLVDGILRRVGIQGGNIVVFFLGYGCAVPAILGTRAATTQKERLMVASLVSLAVPCVAQTGAFIALLGDRSITVLLLMYAISFAAILFGGIMLNRIIPGQIDPMLLEIPNLLKPNREALVKKIWVRTKSFMVEAEVPMIIAIGFAALLVETGALNFISVAISPLVEGWLGLPKEASLGLMLGIVRRELAVLPLLEMDLTTFQLLIGSLVALFYLPCLSVFGVLIKEFSLKIASLIAVGTLTTAFLVAGIISQIGRLFGL